MNKKLDEGFLSFVKKFKTKKSQNKIKSTPKISDLKNALKSYSDIDRVSGTSEHPVPSQVSIISMILLGFDEFLPNSNEELESFNQELIDKLYVDKEVKLAPLVEKLISTYDSIETFFQKNILDQSLHEKIEKDNPMTKDIMISLNSYNALDKIFKERNMQTLITDFQISRKYMKVESKDMSYLAKMISKRKEFQGLDHKKIFNMLKLFVKNIVQRISICKNALKTVSKNLIKGFNTTPEKKKVLGKPKINYSGAAIEPIEESIKYKKKPKIKKNLGWHKMPESWFDEEGVTTWKEDRKWTRDYLKSIGLL